VNRHDRQEAAEAMTALLRAVDEGEITADTPQERRLLRRIEGAVIVLRAHDGTIDDNSMDVSTI